MPMLCSTCSTIKLLSALLAFTTVLGKGESGPCISSIGRVGVKSFYVGSKEVNFFEALEYCHNLGMSLATIESDVESDVIDNYLNKCPYKHHLWVAATDLMKEGRFTWLANSKLIPRNSSKWLAGQPDGKISQNCLLVNGVTSKWEDQSCSFQYCRPLCQNLP